MINLDLISRLHEKADTEADKALEALENEDRITFLFHQKAAHEIHKQIDILLTQDTAKGGT